MIFSIAGLNSVLKILQMKTSMFSVGFYKDAKSMIIALKYFFDLLSES